MLDKERLGTEIKRLRKDKKFTQHQLASGICSQSEISRIEAGEFFPSIDVLYHLANRLQLPIGYFFEVLTHGQAAETKALKDKVQKLSSSKNYEELLLYLEETTKKCNNYHIETKKFLSWQKFMAEYYLKKIDVRNCLTELYLLTKKELAGIDVLLDMHIKNSIANILAENKKYSESIEIYQDILNKNIDSSEADKLKLKILYNYGKVLYLKKAYTSSLLKTNQGIDLSLKLGNMSLLGQFYYQKGALLEETDACAMDIASAYKKAQFFFDLLELKIYKHILMDNKAEFLSSQS